MMNRHDFILTNMNKDTNKILEIGASINPAYPKALGWHTEIVDHESADMLRIKYKDTENYKNIEDVDYIATRNYSKAVNKKNNYDLVFASHVIEHTIDLIEFLNDCSFLVKEKGSVKLVIPNKLHTFDYFREATSLQTVIDNHLYINTSVHTLGTTLENWMCAVQTAHGSTFIPYDVNHEDMKFFFSKDSYDINEALYFKNSYDKNVYIDEHKWVFTPKSFELLIYELNLLQYIDLYVSEIYQNDQNSIEFFAILKRGKIELNRDYMLNLFFERKKEGV